MCEGSSQIICAAYQVVVQPILILLVAIASVWFVMGLLQFISGAKIEERREKGLRHMDQGLIGLVIMFAVFGIIAMIANTLGTDNPTESYDVGERIEIPKL